jgi:CRP-like cAMP-binding protein
MESLERLLREHAVLKGLAEHHLAFLAGCARNVRFQMGDFLFREDEEASASFLIRSGRVALEIDVPGREVLRLETVGEGDLLGWCWLFPPYRWHFDARALEATRAIALDGVCLRQKCEADHDLGYELTKRFLYQVHQRLERSRLQLLDVYRPGS